MLTEWKNTFYPFKWKNEPYGMLNNVSDIDLQILDRSYRITFLIKRKKASLEEVQKFFPYIAICRWEEKKNTLLSRVIKHWGTNQAN